MFILDLFLADKSSAAKEVHIEDKAKISLKQI